jgi:CheY-like chemotaxis protein
MMMTQTKPKLLILDGPDVPADDLAKRLGDRYDVEVRHDPGPINQSYAAILAATYQVRPGRVGESPCGSLLNAVLDAVCMVSAEGTPIWCNSHFDELDEPTRQRIASVCVEASRSFASHDNHNTTPSRRFEISSDDNARVYEILVTPVEEPQQGDGTDEGEPRGQVGHVAALIRDITTARHSQLKMDAIDRAGSELVRLEAETVQKMNVVERLRLLENKIVKYSRDLLQFDHFAIRLIDRRSGKLEVVICSGLPQELMDLDLYPSREGNGITGYVAATGRSYVCNDTETDDLFLSGLHGARSSLTVPLRLHDKVIGVLDVESQQEGAFDEDDRQFAEIFARYIAMALHMLDLLVVERCVTNETVSGRFEGELGDPLDDIEHEIEWFNSAAASDPEIARHVERIQSDVQAIRRRLRDVAAGPQTILGVERAMADSRRDPMLEGRRILIVDDEPKIRRVIGDVLSNRGCSVELCETGEEAIAMLENAAVGPERSFDLVVSDIKLPDRNGYEVFSAARKNLPGVPVILMTGFGYDPHHSIVRASQDGLQSVLFKPFQVDRLLDEVRAALTTAEAT